MRHATSCTLYETSLYAVPSIHANPSRYDPVPIRLLSPFFSCHYRQQINSHPNHHHCQLQSYDTILL